MRTIGVFRDLGWGMSANLPALNEVVYSISPEDSAVVAHYLGSAKPFFDVMEAVRDPLDRAVTISGGSSLICDGAWLWRYDLAYFVSRYRVAVPEEFVRHARERRVVDPSAFADPTLWRTAVNAYYDATRK